MEPRTAAAAAAAASASDRNVPSRDPSPYNGRHTTVVVTTPPDAGRSLSGYSNTTTDTTSLLSQNRLNTLLPAFIQSEIGHSNAVAAVSLPPPAPSSPAGAGLLPPVRSPSRTQSSPAKVQAQHRHQRRPSIDVNAGTTLANVVRAHILSALLSGI